MYLKSRFFLLSLISGALLIVGGITWFLSASETQYLAQIQVTQGQALLVSKFSQAPRQIQKAQLQDLDTLEIAPGANALVHFSKGYSLSMKGPGKIQIEKKADATLISVLSGHLQMINAGERGSVIVQSATDQNEAYQYFLRQARLHGKEALDDFLISHKTQITENNKETLSDYYIKNKLDASQKNFQKCYTHYLQKNDTSPTQATMLITIEASGKVSAAQIYQGTITNNEFKSCLQEVAKRIQFKAFKGEAIQASFPLLFD
ncbi:MAG: AgmX/PglI C-terminal domain-containing protein [Bdellovibrionia bacterium]